VPANSTAVGPPLGIAEVYVTEDMVRKNLSTVRQDKAGGADDLLPSLLAGIQNDISNPLWVLFNKSMFEGAVPDDWRRANVTLIFKKRE